MDETRPRRNGFSLIEILIVMAVMGVLSVIGFSSYQSVQKKGRDVSRKASIVQIEKALEMFANDKGVYPSSSDGKIQWCGSDGSTACPWGNPFTDTAESPTVYLSMLPKDPLSGQTYVYESVDVSGKAKGYRLYARLENENDPEGGSTYTPLCRPGASDNTKFCNYVRTSVTTAPPTSCLITGSACDPSAGSAGCCESGVSCQPYYGFSSLPIFGGFTENCAPHYFCRNSAPTGFTWKIGIQDGQKCAYLSTRCCGGWDACKTYYDASCQEEKFCGKTPPSGYSALPKFDDTHACTDPSQCCSGECNTYYATGSCTAVKLCASSTPVGYSTQSSCCIETGNSCDGQVGNCCAGLSCTAYYRPGSCEAEKFCGSAPAGYTTTPATACCISASGEYAGAGKLFVNGVSVTADAANNCGTSFTNTAGDCKGNFNYLGCDEGAITCTTPGSFLAQYAAAGMVYGSANNATQVAADATHSCGTYYTYENEYCLAKPYYQSSTGSGPSCCTTTSTTIPGAPAYAPSQQLFTGSGLLATPGPCRTDARYCDQWLTFPAYCNGMGTCAGTYSGCDKGL